MSRSQVDEPVFCVRVLSHVANRVGDRAYAGQYLDRYHDHRSEYSRALYFLFQSFLSQPQDASFIQTFPVNTSFSIPHFGKYALFA
jgi:hypothetical protein